MSPASLRVRFPSPEGEGLSGVLVNTAGGVAGGDSFEVEHRRPRLAADDHDRRRRKGL